MSNAEQSTPAMSPAEYQALTLEEVGDDLVVGGVVYSRSEWQPDPEDGVRRRTDIPDRHADDRPPRAERSSISEKRQSDNVPF
ncbi:hypothetical protein ACWF9B_00425 [Streptomyces sp. NPDC055089]